MELCRRLKKAKAMEELRSRLELGFRRPLELEAEATGVAEEEPEAAEAAAAFELIFRSNARCYLAALTTQKISADAKNSTFKQWLKPSSCRSLSMLSVR